MTPEMTNLALSGGAGLVAYAAIVLWEKRGAVGSWLKSFTKGKVTPPPGPSDMDHADLDAIKRLASRAKRSGCPEFVKAVKEVQACFFNQAEAK